MMAKHVTVLCAALIAAWAFIGTSTEANAGCHRCGPVHPVYHYRTVNKVLNRTQYRNVERTHYIHKTRPIYNVTRVRPIVRIHTVTRVHHHTVPVIHDANYYSVQHLAPHYIRTNSVHNVYHGCGCY